MFLLMDNQVEDSEKVYFVTTKEDNLATTPKVQCLELEMVEMMKGLYQIKEISGLANLRLVVLVSSKMLEVMIKKTYL